jgi:hypothetical protein
MSNDRALSNILKDMVKEKQQEVKIQQQERVADIKRRIGIDDKPISLASIMREVVEKE